MKLISSYDRYQYNLLPPSGNIIKSYLTRSCTLNIGISILEPVHQFIVTVVIRTGRFMTCRKFMYQNDSTHGILPTLNKATNIIM